MWNAEAAIALWKMKLVPFNYSVDPHLKSMVKKPHYEAPQDYTFTSMLDDFNWSRDFAKRNGFQPFNVGVVWVELDRRFTLFRSPASCTEVFVVLEDEHGFWDVDIDHSKEETDRHQVTWLCDRLARHSIAALPRYLLD